MLDLIEDRMIHGAPASWSSLLWRIILRSAELRAYTGELRLPSPLEEYSQEYQDAVRRGLAKRAEHLDRIINGANP